MSIDRNVPLPPRGRTGPQNPRWIDMVRAMKVGDSFLMPDKIPNEASGYISYWKQTTGFSFATRKVEGGVRVWRMS